MLRLILTAILPLTITTQVSPATTATPKPTKEVIHIKAPPKPNFNMVGVRLIRCGDNLGTANYIQPNILMTANHVVGENKRCKDVATGLNLIPYLQEKDNDFALLVTDTKRDPRYLKYSCEGYKTGHTYYSLGFAFGREFVLYKMVATENFTDKEFFVDGKPNVHLRELLGTIIPGESGGPIVDENFTIIGINNVTNLKDWDRGWSRELKDTSLCRR